MTKPLRDMTDDELAVAFERGELVVVDIDDENIRRQMLAALDKEEDRA
jgi:hypothetical protein